VAFASADDVAARLGRGTLTAAETAQAELLLDLAAAAIEAATERTETQIRAITPLPPILRVVSIELAVRAMTNPAGLSSRSETVGGASVSERYRDNPGGDLYLNDRETTLVREAVLGPLSGTALVKGTVVPATMRDLAPASYAGDWCP